MRHVEALEHLGCESDGEGRNDEEPTALRCRETSSDAAGHSEHETCDRRPEEPKGLRGRGESRPSLAGGKRNIEPAE